MKIFPLTVLLLAFVAPLGKADDRNSLQISVKNTGGKPAAGVQVLLQNLDVKADPGKQVATDSGGSAVFRNIVPGLYKVSAFEKQTPSAAATMTRVGANGATTVTLGLSKLVQASHSAKKNKRYVYVAAETGTHIGGGRWVEIDDDSGGTGANPVDKRDPRMLTQPQSFGPRAFQGPSH